MTSSFVVGIDPGAKYTGCVLSRIAPYPDAEGCPLIVPVDGITVVRNAKREQERSFFGMPAYGKRVAAEILELLDAHGVAEDDVTLWCVEGLVTPKARPGRGQNSLVGKRVWEGTQATALVLGVMVGTWPEAWIVPPAGTWPDTGKSGWDNVPGESPWLLSGRVPDGWSKPAPGEQRGTHQRSAWHMSVSGWREFWAKAGASQHVDLAAELARGTKARDAVVTAYNPPSAKLSAVVEKVAGRMDLDLLLSAAEVLTPGKGWATWQAMQARLSEVA